MDEQRRAEILRQMYKNLETPIEPYVPRELTWTPREPEPEPPVRRTPDAVRLRQVEQLRRDHEKLAANTADAFHALADEAGAETGKLEKQVNELKAIVEEVRGEFALMRALQPTRPRPRNVSVGNNKANTSGAVDDSLSVD
jgi:hypothetical protein